MMNNKIACIRRKNCHGGVNQRSNQEKNHLDVKQIIAILGYSATSKTNLPKCCSVLPSVNGREKSSNSEFRDKKIPSGATECIREILRVFYHRQKSLRNKIVFPMRREIFQEENCLSFKEGSSSRVKEKFLSRNGRSSGVQRLFFQGMGSL